ncbi:MAG: DUF6110 family protein [Butyrivibrio sp.]|uniref:DUF6110 family protein n=1 Tax=Butyrivibrio sp. TaxID=28121 RepID=UPI0025FFDCDE|nr:DUF6110 family protein [Butyrivibrio sp.]MCR5773348.1 DUF6110 family protein [Butyrivibrio sp.]
MSRWSTLGKIACGFVIGTAGVKVLSSKDAKKCYTHITAAAFRCKDTCLETYTNIKENCQDISADAKEINEKRYADEKAKEIADAKAVLAEAEA